MASVGRRRYSAAQPAVSRDFIVREAAKESARNKATRSKKTKRKK